MRPRVVLYGHGAYDKEDKSCVIPENTTVTFYAEMGSLLDQKVSIALYNGDEVKAEDIEPVEEEIHFLNRDLLIPEKRAEKSRLGIYPKTFKSGDVVPNYFIKSIPEPVITVAPLRKLDVTQCRIEEGESAFTLKEILERFRGWDIHWGACTFVKALSEEAVGYGYAYKFNKSSILKAHYDKPKSDEQKKEERLKKFGPVDTIERKEVKEVPSRESDSRELIHSSSPSRTGFFSERPRDYRVRSSTDYGPAISSDRNHRFNPYAR